MSASQRRKGAAFERRIARDLQALGLDARRGRQDFDGSIEPDVVVDLDTVPITPWIECKCGAHPPLWPAIDQALEAAGDGCSPLVVAHRNEDRESGRKPITIAILEWSEFLALLRIAIEVRRG